MALGEQLLNSARRRRLTISLGRQQLLVLAVALNILGYCGWFLVLHLRSVGWAPGQVLNVFPAYWEWFYRTVFAADDVFAVRRSARAVHHRWYELAAWLLTATGYLAVLRWLRGTQEVVLRPLLWLAAICSIPLLVLPNLLSADVYSYIAFGRIPLVHGGNPFIDPPATFPADPYFQFVGWTQVASVYGPAWIYVSLLLTALVEVTIPHVATYVLAYKLLACAAHLINGVLLWRILGKWRPQQQGWGTALYLLNPLALIEFAGNGHNDVLMITLILWAVLLHLRGKWLWAMAALTLAVLLKWIALPLVGLYGILLLWESASWQLRVRRTLLSLAVFAGLSVALYAPFWEAQGPWGKTGSRHTLQILFDAPPQKRLINSLGDTLVLEYNRLMWVFGKWPHPALVELIPMSPAGGVTIGDNTDLDRESWRMQERIEYGRYIRQQTTERNELLIDYKVVQDRVRLGGLIILGLVCLVGIIRTHNLHTLLLASAWILFTYTAVSAVWVWPWYATWFVALAALLDWRVTGRTAVLVSVLALLIYPLFPVMPDPLWFERYRSLLVFGVPLGFVIYRGMGDRRWGIGARRAKARAATEGPPYN